MHKKHLILIAALFAVTFCGCAKRETIDLGSLHTTVAETETMPETSSESTSQDTDTSEDNSAAGTNTTTLKTEIKKETSGTAEIEYPVIANMKDKEKQDQINALLKTNAMAAADAYSGQTISVQATVESINLRRITVSYKGERKNSSGSTAERIFFTNTVDLETGKNLGLSDFADAYTVAGYIVSGDYRLTDSTAAESAVRSAISSSASTVEAYYKKLQAADFTGSSSSWPEIFSYEKQGMVYVSLPVSAELGGYVLIYYSPDNK